MIKHLHRQKKEKFVSGANLFIKLLARIYILYYLELFSFLKNNVYAAKNKKVPLTLLFIIAKLCSLATRTYHSISVVLKMMTEFETKNWYFSSAKAQLFAFSYITYITAVCN